MNFFAQKYKVFKNFFRGSRRFAMKKKHRFSQEIILIFEDLHKKIFKMILSILYLILAMWLMKEIDFMWQG